MLEGGAGELLRLLAVAGAQPRLDQRIGEDDILGRRQHLGLVEERPRLAARRRFLTQGQLRAEQRRPRPLATAAGIGTGGRRIDEAAQKRTGRAQAAAVARPPAQKRQIDASAAELRLMLLDGDKVRQGLGVMAAAVQKIAQPALPQRQWVLGHSAAQGL